MKADPRDLAAELIGVRQLAQAQKIVAGLEKMGCKWRPIGDRENNYGIINISSDPGHALIERVTNAIDAVIEREAIRQLPKKKAAGLPGSPREAVELWFGIPGGRLTNLEGIKRRQELADNVILRLHDGSHKRKPSVEIRDLGMGLTPAMMPKTILSLGESNKISKPFLAGAYGQGGSTALSASPHGTLIVSRRQRDLLDGAEDEVGVTFVRYVELDPTENRNGRYDYLVGPDDKVLGVRPKGVAFDAGTSVIHFDMEIHRYAAKMTQLTGSLWWLLQNAMFDPVLPFWVEECRPAELPEGKKVDRRTIIGNYTRLSDDKKDKIEHADSVEIMPAHASGRTYVKVNYWVVKEREGSTQTAVDSYVDAYHPIAYTLYGQLHGTDERREISERLHLPNLANALIVQVELDNMSAPAKRDLLSTTRDRMKQSPFFDNMRARIWEALAEDQDLIRLDQERKEKLLAHHSDRDREKLRERFAKLLERFKAGSDAKASGKGSTESGRKEPTGSSSREKLTPLPTKKEPTFIRIANVQKPVKIRLERSALLRLESDAPDGYLTNRPHASLMVACDPDGVIELESRSDFRGGRARVTVRPTTTAKVGAKGTLTVILLTTSKQTYSSKIGFVVEAAEDESTAGAGGKAKVQVPETVAVTEKGPGPKWADMGGGGWTDKSVAEVRVDGRDTTIYVNVDGQHIAKLLRSSGYQQVGMKRMRNSYLLYAGYYAYVQYVALAGKRLPLEGKAFEEYKAAELDRVSQTIVHSISAAGRLDGDEE